MVVVPLTDIAKKFGMVRISGTTRRLKMTKDAQDAHRYWQYSSHYSPYPRTRRTQHLLMVQKVTATVWNLIMISLQTARTSVYQMDTV